MVVADVLDTRPPLTHSRERWSRNGLVVFARRYPLGALSALVLVVLILVAIFADHIAPYLPHELLRGVQPLSPPSSEHLLGTDELSRDIFSRLVFGARVSLAVGLFATLGSAILGAALGLMAAQFRGVVDAVIVRIIDVVQAIPGIVFLIGLLSITGPGIPFVILALAIRSTFPFARVVRGSALALGQELYVEAAVLTGCSRLRIMLRHLLPNLFPVVLVVMSISAGGLIVAEAALSFLGYGIRSPDTSWGLMMGGSSRIYMTAAPQILFGPSLALVITVLAINYFADALRDHLDPRLRDR